MNLTQRPPRSPRVRLGDYVILPRMLDKCRAELVGTIGEYHYNCPLDQNFLRFTGLDPDLFKAEVAKGLGDGDVLAWVTANAPIKRTEWDVDQWSSFRETAVPRDNETREYVSGEIAKGGGAAREDIATFFDYIDFDDHVTFGGKA